MSTYIRYQNSNYVVLEDGRPARLLKPTHIHKQEYYNFVLDGKQKRVSLGTLRKLVGEPSAQPESNDSAN